MAESLLNPVTTFARDSKKFAFDYLIKEYKSDKSKLLYLQLAVNVIQTKLESKNAFEIREAIKMLEEITEFLISRS